MQLSDTELAAEIAGRAESFAAWCEDHRVSARERGARLRELLRQDAALLLPEIAGDDAARAAQIDRALAQINRQHERRSGALIEAYLSCWHMIAIGLRSRTQRDTAGDN